MSFKLFNIILLFFCVLGKVVKAQSDSDVNSKSLLNVEIEQFHNLDYHDFLREAVWNNHHNLRLQLMNKSHVHTAARSSNSGNITIANAGSVNYIGSSNKKHFSPYYPKYIEYGLRKWMALHSTAVHATTCAYVDKSIAGLIVYFYWQKRSFI